MNIVIVYHSDYTDEDQENEHETDPWASLKMEAMKKICQNLKS